MTQSTSRPGRADLAPTAAAGSEQVDARIIAGVAAASWLGPILSLVRQWQAAKPGKAITAAFLRIPTAAQLNQAQQRHPSALEQGAVGPWGSTRRLRGNEQHGRLAPGAEGLSPAATVTKILAQVLSGIDRQRQQPAGRLVGEGCQEWCGIASQGRVQTQAKQGGQALRNRRIGEPTGGQQHQAGSSLELGTVDRHAA